MIGPWSTLDEIIARTVELRKLQQELRGHADEVDSATTPDYWTSYRYGDRQTRNRRRT